MSLGNKKEAYMKMLDLQKRKKEQTDKAEEWILFLRERLHSIKNSVVEHNNVEVVKFSWPSILLQHLNEPSFKNSLTHVARLRNEMRDL